jgi:4-amino-4-deoxy-L-arabinose transferase-like glycosyltransferase
MAVFFSIGGFFHRYYLSMLAPGIAALAGIGLVLLWRDYRNTATHDWHGWLLLGALVLTSLTQAVILADYSGWNSWLTPLIVGGTLVVAWALVWQRAATPQSAVPQSAGAYAALAGIAGKPVPLVELEPEGWTIAAADARTQPTREERQTRRSRHAYGPLLTAALGVGLLLVGPATWAGVSLANAGNNGTLPAAGPTATTAQISGFAGGRFADGRPSFNGTLPEGLGGFGGFGPPGGIGEAGTPSGGIGGSGATANGLGGNDASIQVNSTLLTYLKANQGSATYLFATESSHTAAPYIIETGKAVMALGGFSGSDQILTVSQLQTLVSEGQVHYFLLSGGGFGGAGDSSGNAALVQWVEAHGTTITVSGVTLYYVSSAAAGS